MEQLTREDRLMAFNGKYYKGYMRHIRAIKREEAEARSAETPPERTKRYRTDWHFRETEALDALRNKLAEG